MNKDLLIRRSIISVFVALYVLVSLISTVHVIDFFELSNPTWMAITLAIGFEVGAAASLASLIILDKMNKTLVWALFIVITAMQINGNLYYAFINLDNYQGWSELFNLVEEEPLYQRRILSIVSGAILPLVALGFIKSLVDYIRPAKSDGDEVSEKPMIQPPVEDSEPAEMSVEKEPVDEAPAEEWDEMHAHDMVLNDMVNQVESVEESVEDFVQPVLEEEEEEEEIVLDPQDEDWLFQQAMNEKAQEKLDNYLNEDQNDQGPRA